MFFSLSLLVNSNEFKKKIQIQNANAFAAAKFGIDASKMPNQASVTKYASVSNGSNGMLNTSGNQLTNGSVNNVSTSNNSNVSNLMRSFLTSSNNPNKILNTHQNRSYYNHLNPSNNNSAINIFTENDQSTYSFKPSDNTLNNFNTR